MLTDCSAPFKIRPSCFGSVAQSVEQRTFNPLVASSNLARPTKSVKQNYLSQPLGWLFCFLLAVWCISGAMPQHRAWVIVRFSDQSRLMPLARIWLLSASQGAKYRPKWPLMIILVSIADISAHPGLVLYLRQRHSDTSAWYDCSS